MLHVGIGCQSKVDCHLMCTCVMSLCMPLGRQDVDQRLTRDIERLCNDLAALIPNMVKPVVDLLW